MLIRAACSTKGAKKMTEPQLCCPPKTLLPQLPTPLRETGGAWRCEAQGHNLSWSLRYSAELSGKPVWSEVCGLHFGAREMPGRWPRSLSLGTAAPTLPPPASLFPGRLGKQTGEVLRPACFPSVSISIWSFLFSNMGYETNPVNVTKKTPLATRSGDSSCPGTPPTAARNSASSLSPHLCALHVVRPSRWGQQSEGAAGGCLGPQAGTTASVLYRHPPNSRAFPRPDCVRPYRGVKIQFPASSPDALLLTNPLTPGLTCHQLKGFTQKRRPCRSTTQAMQPRQGRDLTSTIRRNHVSTFQGSSIVPFVWVWSCFLAMEQVPWAGPLFNCVLSALPGTYSPR